jgi:hypothetical protein
VFLEFSRIRRILSIWTVSFHVFSVHKQFQSAYYRSSYRQFPSACSEKHIVKMPKAGKILHFICIISFYVFSVYGYIHSVYSLYMLNFNPHTISMSEISFCVFSANANFFLESCINSAYSQYTLNFIPHIIGMRKISFRVFDKCSPPLKKLNFSE